MQFPNATKITAIEKGAQVSSHLLLYFTKGPFYMAVKYPWVKDSRNRSASLVFNLFGVPRTKYFYLFTEEC